MINSLITCSLFLVSSVMLTAQPKAIQEYFKDYRSSLNVYLDQNNTVEDRRFLKSEIIKDFFVSSQSIVFNDARPDGSEYIAISEYLDNLIIDNPRGIRFSFENMNIIEEGFKEAKVQLTLIKETHVNVQRLSLLFALKISAFGESNISASITGIDKFEKTETANKTIQSWYEKANKLYESYNIKQAIYWWTKAAEEGYSPAQVDLGYIYSSGDAQIDYEKAIFWYRKAAFQGNTEALMELAYLYEEGEGVDKNFKKAFDWVKKAAFQGDANAQVQLAFYYEEGTGVEKNLKEAFKWYESAAQQGDKDAQYFLGQAYEEGKGTIQSYQQAFSWYEQAANQNVIGAKSALGRMYDNGFGVKENDKLAIHWWEKAANQGSKIAQYNLGSIYSDETGNVLNIKKAIYWYEKAIQRGHSEAQFSLGSMYLGADGVTKDYQKAKNLFEQAAAQNNTNAMAALGKIHQEGLGVPINYEKAIYLYQKAIDQDNNMIANHNMGILLVLGLGIKENRMKGMTMLEISCNKGFQMACDNLIKIK